MRSHVHEGGHVGAVEGVSGSVGQEGLDEGLTLAALHPRGICSVLLLHGFDGLIGVVVMVLLVVVLLVGEAATSTISSCCDRAAATGGTRGGGGESSDCSERTETRLHGRRR